MSTKNVNDDLFIGLDIGGSAIKSILYNKKGETIATGNVAFPPVAPKPSWQEKDMLAVWEATKQTLKEVAAIVGDLVSNIRVVGITGAGYGAWFIDKNGNPIRSGVTGADSRAESIVSEWHKNGVADKYYQYTGSGIFSGSAASVIKWFSINEPEVLDKAAYVLTAQEWLHYKLSNDVRTDETGASITVGDIRTNKYSEEILKLLGIEKYGRLFPPIKTTFELTGYIVPEVAKEVGLPLSVQINNAPTDITSCSIGVGNIREGDAFSCLGTGLGSLFITKDMKLNEFMNAQTMAIDTPDVKYIHSVIPIFGSPNQDWFINNFCAEDKVKAEKQGINIYTYLEKKVKRIPAGAEGILYNPLICNFGENLPFVHKTDTTHFIGLNQQHTRYHMLRALYEGVAFAIKRTYASVGENPKGTILSGGGARSDLWCQIISDVLGIAVKVPADEECGAKGAAINAAFTGGYFATHAEAVHSMVSYERYFEPNELNSKRYQKIYELYKETYNLLIPIWDKLDKLKKEV